MMVASRGETVRSLENGFSDSRSISACYALFQERAREEEASEAKERGTTVDLFEG